MAPTMTVTAREALVYFHYQGPRQMTITKTDRDRFESGETFVVCGEQCHGMAGSRAYDADEIFDEDGDITPDFEQFDRDRETAASVAKKGGSFWWKIQAVFAELFPEPEFTCDECGKSGDNIDNFCPLGDVGGTSHECCCNQCWADHVVEADEDAEFYFQWIDKKETK
jgi:hypothetical protein